MFKSKAAVRFQLSTLWIAVAAMLAAVVLPLLASTQSVQAAQLLDRSITMDSSAANATTTYTVDFDVPNNGAENIGSFRIEFCDNSPLPGTTCTYDAVDDDIPGLNGVSVTADAFDDTGGSDECTTLTETTPGASDRHIDWSCDVADDISDIGTFTATITLVDNPDNSTDGGAGFHNNTFYARLYTYAATTPTAIANPVTGYNNEGGLALSTAEQITVEARVQENITFEVYNDTDTATDCDEGSPAGTTVEVGVVDFSNANENRATVDSVDTATPDLNGICTKVSTNAANGVTIGYLTTDLQVSGETCNEADTAIDGTEVSTDKCFNYDDDSPIALNPSVEGWGIQVLNIEQGLGGITTALTVPNADYNATTPDDVFPAAPDAAGTTNLATSSGSVVDQEALFIDVGAAVAATTPTGLYSATLTFIATSTF